VCDLFLSERSTVEFRPVSGQLWATFGRTENLCFATGIIWYDHLTLISFDIKLWAVIGLDQQYEIGCKICQRSKFKTASYFQNGINDGRPM